jgi:hypothetical protein
MWTQFMDMHSGGSLKEKWQYIYIEAPEKIARIVFYNRFGHNPDRVTCTCCGEDYSVSESKTLEEATAYKRDCRWDGKKYVKDSKSITLEQYKKKKDVHFIYAKDIKPQEKVGEVPEQGYVWMD